MEEREFKTIRDLMEEEDWKKLVDVMTSGKPSDWIDPEVDETIVSIRIPHYVKKILPQACQGLEITEGNFERELFSFLIQQGLLNLHNNDTISLLGDMLGNLSSLKSEQSNEIDGKTRIIPIPLPPNIGNKLKEILGEPDGVIEVSPEELKNSGGLISLIKEKIKDLDDGEPCDCPSCRARREEMKNTTVH